MSPVAEITAEFQQWIGQQDELGKQVMLLSTHAMFSKLSMEEVSELMAMCFAAGHLCAVRSSIETERKMLMDEYSGAPN